VLVHPIWTVLLFYAVVAIVMGIILAVVFQIAHCVEEADFPLPKEGTTEMEKAWAVHQVETTVDFARGSKLATWFLGGLNYQVEHHLFPRICHIHYPELSKVVESTCREYGVRYAEHRTFWTGVASHYRWLRRMALTEGEA
jgi:linoleoyl-CoA desaturase